MPEPFPIADTESLHQLRAPVTRRLMARRERGELRTWQVELPARRSGGQGGVHAVRADALARSNAAA